MDRWYCPPNRIEDQSWHTTCGPHAVNMLAELYWERKLGSYTKFSPGSISAFQLSPDALPEGMAPYEIGQIMIAIGIAEYSMLQQDADNPEILKYVTDMDALKENAKKYKFKHFEIIHTIDEIKEALKDCPVLMATAIPKEFSSFNGNNYTLKEQYSNSDFYGWHFTLIADVHDDIQMFELINSYGPNWGKDGTYLMPYEYPSHIPMTQIMKLVPFKEVKPMEIQQQFLFCNRSGVTISPKGTVIHSTADQGATAQDLYVYLNSREFPPAEKGTANYCVDWDEIIQYVPDNEMSYGCGPTGNHLYLNIEMSEPRDSDPDRFNKFNRVWDNTVWLVANKCVSNGWGVEEGVHSHYGIAQSNHETDHTDPYPYFARYGKTWQSFIDSVQAKINELKGGEYDMKHAVIYFTDRDMSVARIVADKLGGCATYCRNGNNAFVHPDWAKAEHIVVVGGAFNIAHPNATNCCGVDAPETAILTGQYAQKL